MTTQAEKADRFHSLHKKGEPLIIFNIWDPGSAKTVEDAGAQSLATGSAPVAMSQNYKDGEHIPLELSLTNAKRIVSLTELPVSLDFEGAYASDPDGVRANTSRVLETGVVGVNFEDQIVGSDQLYELQQQVERIQAMRQASSAAGVNLFINSRTDSFLKAPREEHSESMLDEAIERADAFAAAGADGFFAPNLVDERLIEMLCKSVQLPVNIIALPGCPDKQTLCDLGVARISYGPVPYRKMMAALKSDAEAAFA
ncbi:MAG: isocitrate lyase/phosphoenolpyruvate mutase family protein [Pseudomonadota bacterium]